MTLNDKDYEKINEAAKTLIPILEEIADILLSVLNNEKAMQKLIDEAVKKAVQDAQAKQTYNITEVKDISTGYAEPYHKITANARSNLR